VLENNPLNNNTQQQQPGVIQTGAGPSGQLALVLPGGSSSAHRHGAPMGREPAEEL
jgi:hypothetical protein